MAKAMVESDDRARLLAERAQAGDKAALGDLFQTYRERLEAGIEVELQSRGLGCVDAEEILQETFLQAVESVGRFRWKGGDSFYLWICGIARNLVSRATKKHLRARTIQLPEQVPATGAPPSKLLRRQERFDRLEEAFALLPPDYREVLRLARLEGLKVREIARRMGRSENAVRHLMARAVLELRRRFGDTESLGLPDRVFKDPRDTHGKG
jgi:RNA polymerase sigma-70 factor (ECF subfamily)